MASSSGPSEIEPDIINDYDVAETDPTGKYVRYNKVIGYGSTKMVYLGLDRENAMEVAWCKSEIPEKTTKSKGSLRKLFKEGNLLKSLEHENILKCYQAWGDRRGNVTILHLITEIFACGTLFEYIKKHNLGHNLMAIKNWARQILDALDYLHTRSPPIIHHDIKGDNIFVDGKTGRIKLADFDQAMNPSVGCVQAFGCTPYFMAPDLMADNYDQKIDIYSFGMCVVQMVSQESPYSEFKYTEVCEKVAEGVLPLALEKVTDPETLRFIRKCLIRNPSARPTAMNLLNDPFLARSGSGTVDSPMQLVKECCNDKGDKFKLKGTRMENGFPMTLRIIPKEVKIDFILKTDSLDSIKKTVRGLDLSSAENVRLVSELTGQVTAGLNARPLPRSNQQYQDRELELELELEQHEDSEDKGRGSRRSQPRCFGKLQLFKGFKPGRKS